MEKQRSAILLVLLLLLICAGWLSVSFYKLPGASPAGTVASVAGAPGLDANYQPPQSLTVEHTASGGQDVYSGSLLLPECDTFATTISTSGTNPAHLTLAFTVLAYPACSSQEATSSPFSISTGSQAGAGPVLDAVLINGKPVRVSLLEQ